MVSLSPAEPLWKVDAKVRVRFESRDQTYTFNRAVPSVTDDSWWLTRFRVGLRGEFSPQLTGYIQMQDSREFGSQRSSVPFISGSEGDDPLDVRQAYVELKGSEMTWRVGRQLLALADERLVGLSDWSNYSRSFDAARVTWPKFGGGLDAFASSVVRVQPGGTTGWRSNHASRSDIFTGVYSRFNPVEQLRIEPYVFLRRSTQDVVYSAGAAGSSRPFDIPQKITTVGVRLNSAPDPKRGGFDADADLAGQAGEARGRQSVAGAMAYPGPDWLEHRAWAWHAGIGYTTNLERLPLRFYAEANQASGDRDPTDRRTHSFFNLFPANHRLYGRMDVFAWKNLREVAVAAATTVSGFNARIEHHWLALDNVQDTWFRANGSSIVRPLTAQARRAPRRAGSETDVVVSGNLGKHVLLELGGSIFAAGPYLAATGGASDARLGYLQTTLEW